MVEKLRGIGTLTLGSACTGSNVTTCMLHTLFKVLGAGKLRDVFGCEFVPALSKASWATQSEKQRRLLAIN